MIFPPSLSLFLFHTLLSVNIREREREGERGNKGRHSAFAPSASTVSKHNADRPFSVVFPPPFHYFAPPPVLYI
jgi:hypothetical protein